MDCIRFREQYSEFADGFLDEAAEIEMIRHTSECEACRRMDAGYRTGSTALRELPDLAVPIDFHDRLQARILAAITEPEPAARWRRWPTGALAVLAIMAAAGWQMVDRTVTSATANPSPFIMTLAPDSTFTWPGRVPMLPLASDTFRTSARPASSFQIAVDYMIVP